MQFAKDAFCKFHAGGGDGHGPCPEFSFRADALADFERTLKETIKDRAGGALFVGDAIGFADLAEDFRFAEHHGIEAGGYTKKMANRVAIVMVIERRTEKIELNGMETGKVVRKSGGGFARGFR